MAFPYVINLHGDASTPGHLVPLVKAVARPVGLLTIFLGVVTLLGYALNIEFLYRPLLDGPATNPLTAMIVVLIAASFELGSHKGSRSLALMCCLSAGFLCLVHLWCLLLGNHLSAYFMPFRAVVDADIAMGKDNSMGLNTTLMLMLLVIAHFLFHFKFSMTSQLFALTALCVPMVSVTGYAYGLSHFYGHMSLLSTTFGVFLGISALAVTADKGGLKAVLSPYIGGKIARLQILFGYLMPFLVGFLVVRSLVNSSENSIFGVYVVAVCWFIILLVIVSAIAQEKVDIRRREVEKALQHTATTDELTQLPNRRAFMTAVERLSESMAKSSVSAWCFMIDIDYFKRINDSAGHLIGDKVLVELAKVLKTFVRAEDAVCRMGGEEFVIVLYGMNRHQATLAAERIRQAVERIDVIGYTDRYGHFTASIGCAQLTPNASISHVLDQADIALYNAKETGRNKVSFNDTLPLAG